MVIIIMCIIINICSHRRTAEGCNPNQRCQVWITSPRGRNGIRPSHNPTLINRMQGQSDSFFLHPTSFFMFVHLSRTTTVAIPIIRTSCSVPSWKVISKSSAMRATHLFAFKHGQDMVNAIFGKIRPKQLFHTKNGILFHQSDLDLIEFSLNSLINKTVWRLTMTATSIKWKWMLISRLG